MPLLHETGPVTEQSEGVSTQQHRPILYCTVRIRRSRRNLLTNTAAAHHTALVAVRLPDD